MSGIRRETRPRGARIAVLVASGFALVVEGVRHSLEDCEDMDVVGEASDGVGSVEQTRMLKPDVVIIDSGLRVLDGFETARRLSREMPQCKVVLMTERGGRDSVAEALLAGAQGCLPMATSRADLANAVRTVHRGGMYLHPSLTRCIVEEYITLRRASGYHDSYERLTDRERHVLRLLAEGKNGPQVAQELGIAVKTANGHVSRVMNKLGIHARGELIKYAIRRGLVDLDR